MYKEEYNLDEERILFVFNIPSKWKETVVEPFLQGKYSEIDREYVKRYFPESVYKSGNKEPSVNYMILNKDELLKNYWENMLDVDLDEDAEVWSKVDLEREILFLNKKSKDVEII